jgi:Ca-activated chloride channel homolog
MLASSRNYPLISPIITACMVGVAALFAGMFPGAVWAQPAAERPNVMIVLDASGSMRAKMDGRTRIDIAKDTLSTVLSEIPEAFDIGLIAYGHRERGSCLDIETIVASGPARQSVPEILERGRSLRALGKTPLTAAVRKAAEELKYTEDKATVILITDGIETCEADPCALGRELARDGVGFTAHVVGFGLTEQEGQQVACLADNTGGQYVPANNADDLTGALRDLVQAGPEPAPVPDEPEANLQAPETVAQSSEFTVRWDGPGEPYDAVMIFDPRAGQTGGNVRSLRVDNAPGFAAREITLLAPGELGTYELQYWSSKRKKVLATAAIEVVETVVSLTPPPGPVPMGMRFKVAWQGPGRGYDDIHIVDPAADGGKGKALRMQRLNQDKAFSKRLATLIAPLAAGRYELRYYNGENRTYLASVPIDVTPIQLALMAPPTADAGTKLTVGWAGPGEGYDDLILKRLSDDKTAVSIRLDRDAGFTNGLATLQLPPEPGAYELQYFDGTNRKVILRHAITLVASGASAWTPPASVPKPAVAPDPLPVNSPPPAEPQQRGDAGPASGGTVEPGADDASPAQERSDAVNQQAAGSGSGWLTPQPPARPEPPGMSCDDLRNKVAGIMFSTNIAVQQQLIGIGEREGFAGGPPSEPADCARLARAFADAGIAAFDVAGAGQGARSIPAQPMPSSAPQPVERADGTPTEPVRRDTIEGAWSLERSGFKAVVTVKRPDGPPPIGSYQPYDIEMRVESRPGDGCPKESAWQAICKNVHQYGSYIGNAEVSAGAVVPSNTGRYLNGQLIGDVMLPVQISLDRGWLWVSLPKGEMWGEAPSGPAGWYNLRFAAVAEGTPQSDALAQPQPQQSTAASAAAPEFPGTAIWAIVDNEMDIGRVSNADRIERCRREPRIGFGDGVLVHRRENPNWQLGQSPAPGNPGPFITLSVRECDRAGEMLECLEKPISPLNGQPMAEAARILQFRLEPHAQSGGIRGCPVNAQHMAGGKHCSIALPCDDAELDMDLGGQNLLALVTAPVPGYAERKVSKQASDAPRNSDPKAGPAGSGVTWGCQLVFGHLQVLNRRARDDRAFGDRFMSALADVGLIDTVKTWREEPPVDRQLCNAIATALAAGGIEPFTRASAPNLATCDDFRAIADHLPKYRDLPGFEMTDEQSSAAFGLIRSEWGNADPSDAQCQAMAAKWRDLSIPGFGQVGGVQITPAAAAPAEPQGRGGSAAAASAGTWSCLYVNGQISAVDDAALRSGPTRDEALFNKVMRTLRTKGFMSADQSWGANPTTDQATCDRLGDAMREAGIPGFAQPNAGTINSCQDLRAVAEVLRKHWDKFGLTAQQVQRALDLPRSPSDPGLSDGECRAIGDNWVRLGLPGLMAAAAAAPERAQPVDQRRGDGGAPVSPGPHLDQGLAVPSQSETKVRAVAAVRQLYKEHLDRSRRGSSIFESAAVAIKSGGIDPTLARAIDKSPPGFDPVFDAQDFDISALSFEADSRQPDSGEVAVVARFKNFGKQTRVRYLVRVDAQGAQITDIEGKGWRLRQMLKLGRSG